MELVLAGDHAFSLWRIEIQFDLLLLKFLDLTGNPKIVQKIGKPSLPQVNRVLAGFFDYILVSMV
jgi:hypothetical protein